MNKILTLAALLGYAMGNQVFGWEKTENLLENEWANLNVKLDFDWSYGTHWFKIPATETTYGYGTHIYGADTHSRVAFTAWGEFAKFF